MRNFDDRVLALLMLAVSAPRVVLAFADHETFGAETTVASLFTVLALLMLLTSRRARRN